jgi:hypothetical protein
MVKKMGAIATNYLKDFSAILAKKRSLGKKSQSSEQHYKYTIVMPL